MSKEDTNHWRQDLDQREIPSLEKELKEAGSSLAQVEETAHFAEKLLARNDLDSPPSLPPQAVRELDRIRKEAASSASDTRVRPATRDEGGRLRARLGVLVRSFDLGWLNGPRALAAGGAVAGLLLLALVLPRGDSPPKTSSAPGVSNPTAVHGFLSPSGQTGYDDPLISLRLPESGREGWQVELQDKSGRIHLGTAQASSLPAAVSAFARKPLDPGEAYRLVLKDPEGHPRGMQSFVVLESALSSPERKSDLSEFLRQCDQLIGERRSGDAWMLWQQLTAEERQDPRLQALRTRILDEIG